MGKLRELMYAVMRKNKAPEDREVGIIIPNPRRKNHYKEN